MIRLDSRGETYQLLKKSLSPEGLLQLKKLKAHEHYLNSKSKKREANPLGRRPTNQLHHNNYNVDNLSQNINNDTTTTTTNNNDDDDDNNTNDGSNKNNNDNIYDSDGDLNNNNNTINNDNDNNEKGTTDDNTVSFKLDEILDETHK